MIVLSVLNEVSDNSLPAHHFDMSRAQSLILKEIEKKETICYLIYEMGHRCKNNDTGCKPIKYRLLK